MNQYDTRYDQPAYYWGTRPSAICLDVLRLMPPDRPLRLLDIGCGEGRNAVDWSAPFTPELIAKTPNLLAQTGAVITANFAKLPASLIDGKLDPPAQPWCDWGALNWVGDNWTFNWVQLDTIRTQVRADAITIVEDPGHPESWIRDAYLEYWDAAREKFVFVQTLLSDSAIHTHRLAKPIEAARFRIALPPTLVGNLRWAEVVLHGEALGNSHPDVIAKRPVAVLFDDGEDAMKSLMAGKKLTFELGGALSAAIDSPSSRPTAPLLRPKPACPTAIRDRREPAAGAVSLAAARLPCSRAEGGQYHGHAQRHRGHIA